MNNATDTLNEFDIIPLRALDETEWDEKYGHLHEEVDQKSAPPLGPQARQSLSAHAEELGIALASDFDHVVDQMQTLTTESATEILLTIIEIHSDDLNFPTPTMHKIKELVQGAKAADMAEDEWYFQIRAEAAIIHFWSPYPEVRSVTSPNDDPNTPCETIRVYAVGIVFIIGSSALNNFFHSRIPTISLGPDVLQILVYPVGWTLSKILPDWGLSWRGTRYSLNPGPWSFKEQTFCVVFFDISIAGLYDTFLVQRLDRYLKQDWVSFGYEILLTLSVSFLGFSYAGLLRRFAVFPSSALWPSVLPTLALSRALTLPEPKGQLVNGWRLSRYTFFGIFTIAMFVWFWIPNFLFAALREFNWMTWIAPNNFNLACVTGFWGGMGYSPWATFDYNIAGKGKLTTPFFSTLQGTGGMAVAGLVILAMYYANMYWAAYMPPNSNTVYANDGKEYQPAKVLNAGGTDIDVAKYKAYGPPYYTAYGVFQHGQSYAWNTLVVVYIYIKHWPMLKRGFQGIIRTLTHTDSVYAGHQDANIRLYRRYKEVPEWWFGVIFLFSLGAGIAAVSAWPTQTPWWSIIIALVFTGICIIPMTFILAQANVTIETTAILQILASAMFPRKIQPLLMFSAFGTNNLDASRSYASDLKLGLYARIPPRTLFRGQMLAVLVKSFVLVIMVNWLTTSFDVGTLCTINNPDHFICNSATSLFGNATLTGMLGVDIVFRTYPILPWCFLIGGLIGGVWALLETRGPKYRSYIQRRYRNQESTTSKFWHRFFGLFHYISYINPAIFWSGAHLWGGASNLSYNIQGIYVSFVFMYYIKRRYPAWWEKYNYLLEMAFTCGIAFSGLVQTLATKFGSNPISAPVWWGNTISTAGIDYKIFTSKAALRPIPAEGYFGLPPDQYPNPF